MTISLRKRLTAFLLFVVVLLAPLNSFAHDATTGVADICSCQMMPADCGADEPDQPDGCPPDNGQECCDCEDHYPEGAEPPIVGNLVSTVPGKQIFPPTTNGLIPEVYLAIFVPPQNCSFR